MTTQPDLAAILETRKPVWFALSNLFLCSEFKEDVETIAKTLAASPYSLTELEAILRDELSPVLKLNLSIFAWPGDAFDKEFLVAKLTRRLHRKPWLNFGLPKPIRKDWQTIQELIQLYRQTPASTHSQKAS
ncbi:MAG: hypothetical protein E6Q83_06985 [Thiothrix sp.]|nr:MAG: hypothetical protein E6Q83_06985 [Thiothrix sp.]